MRPTSRQTTMVGPTQGGDGFGLGRGGGWYRRRLERDFGMRSVPFPGRRPARRGRVVVVNFWASWGGPCREEMPALEEFSRAYAEEGKPVTVIGVDASDVRSEAARFL